MASIHSTAIIEKGAELGVDVEVGPYCVIGPHVTVGDGTSIMSHVVLDGWTTFGKECTIFPFASIGTQTQDLKYKGDKTFVEIGDRTTLREYVTVNSSTNEGEVTRVGSDCHIMAYVHVAHQCDVGNRVIMANCATLAGHVTVEDKAIIGGLTAVHQFVNIGCMCMVGGYSRIVQDCLPYMIVEGRDAKVRGVNRIGLERNNVDENARKLIKEAYKTLCRKNLSTSQAVEQIRAGQEQCPELEHLVAFIESSERGITKYLSVIS